MIKKFLTSILVAAFMMLWQAPLSGAVTAEDNMSLSEFLKTTDDIEASFKYPSMKLASQENTKGKTVLEPHTPIIIRCDETITTNNIVNGSMVRFSVVRDVKSKNGNILIKSGAPVTAQITFSKSKGMIGRSGEVTVSDFHTTAVDGTYIPLSGSVSAKPDDKMVLSIVLGVIVCPLFLLMKGEEAQLPVGATKTAYTVIENYIQTESL